MRKRKSRVGADDQRRSRGNKKAEKEVTMT